MFQMKTSLMSLLTATEWVQRKNPILFQAMRSSAPAVADPMDRENEAVTF